MINKKRLINTFKELVVIDSPSENEGKITEFVAKKLTEMGGKVTRDKFGNIIAKFRGEGSPIMLNAHLDTVEPGRGIVPRISGKKIVSSGATILGGDAKAGVSIILEAIESAHEKNIKTRPIELVLTLEEETTLGGAKNLDYSKIKSTEGIVFDGDEEVFNLYISSPTYYNVDIEIIGKGAHAGVEPEKGISAIELASQLIGALPLGRVDLETTMNIGLIEGGSARNTVPEKVILHGEIRSRNKKTLKKLLQLTKSMTTKVERDNPGSKIHLLLEKDFEGFVLKKDNLLIKKMIKTLEAINLKPELQDSGGGSDANIFCEHGIEVAIVGTGVYLSHTTREFVVIDEMVQASDFCLEFIKL